MPQEKHHSEGSQDHPTSEDLAQMLFPVVPAQDLKTGEVQNLTSSAENNSVEGDEIESGPESIEELTFEDAKTLAAGRQFSPDQEDLPWVAQFLAGDDRAFLKLYAKYEAPLLVYCRRMIPNRVAEDAFQEIWMKLFELRKRDVQITNFRALLFRSARNMCLNIIGAETTRQGSSEALVNMFAPDESNFETEQKEMQILLRRALGKLPFEQREAFVLHEYSGYAYSEIAEMMATTEANIKIRAYRARIRLRKLIASWLRLGEDDDPANMI